MKHILITGIAGYIGTRIAQALLDHDQEMQVVGIDIREPSFSHPNLTFIRQDVREPIIDLLKTRDIDTIVHTAYVLAPDHDTRRMEEINVLGTKNILEGAREAGVTQILYTSSTTAYGFYPDNEIPLTEDSPLRGNDDFTYAKNKKEIEALVAVFVKENPGISVTVLRPCYVAGPGLDNPLSTHLKKSFVPLIKDTAPLQYVHEDDLIRIMVLCLEQKLAGIFNVSGDGTITFPAMVKLLGNTPVLLPEFLVRLFNGLAWHLRLTWVTQFPNPALNLMRHPWIATSKKLVKTTGYKFEYDTQGAFSAFADHIKKEEK